MSIPKIYHNLRVYGEITSAGLTIQRPVGSAGGYSFPISDGIANQVLTTNGEGTLSFQDVNSLALTTDDVPEGLINPYFTNERVDDRVAVLIQNGIGITWTYDDPSDNFTGNVNLTPFTADDLAEGSTNFYFTNEKVDDRVSGLIINGTGLNWTYNDAANTLQGVVSLSPFTTDDLAEGSTNLYFTNEAAQDAVASLVQNGTGISFIYNDIANTLTPTVTLSPFTTDDLTEGSSNLYLTSEAIDDRISSLVQDTSTVTWTYNDIANTLSADAFSMVKVQKNGVLVGSRDTINFIEGTDILLSVADDAVNNKTNVTIAYNGLGGGERYDLNATQDGANVDLNLTSVSTTDDSVLQLTAGPNISLVRNSANEVTISSKSGGSINLGDRITNIMHTSLMWSWNQSEDKIWGTPGEFYVGPGSTFKSSPGWNDQDITSTSGQIGSIAGPELRYDGGYLSANILIPMPVNVRVGDQIKICMTGFIMSDALVDVTKYQIATGFHGTNCPMIAIGAEEDPRTSIGKWGTGELIAQWGEIHANGTFCHNFIYDIATEDVSEGGIWINGESCKNLFGFGIGWNWNSEDELVDLQKGSFSLRADYITKFPYTTGKLDIKFKQDSVDSKKYEVQVKSTDQEVSLQKFELTASPVSGARISSAELNTEVFDATTWTSTVNTGLRTKGKSGTISDWTVSDQIGNPNPVTIIVDEFVSGATINFDSNVDLLPEDIENQVWTTSTGVIVNSRDITVTIELAKAADEKEAAEGK